MIDFARLGLLIVVLAFSVQANERAKRVIEERRLQRALRVGMAADAQRRGGNIKISFADCCEEDMYFQSGYNDMLCPGRY